MSTDCSTLLDQLNERRHHKMYAMINEALASQETALVFIETFLGLMTEKRQMFLNLLVPKLQFDDLDLVLQKANQRINGQKNLFVLKIENSENDNIIPVKQENKKVDEDFIIDEDPLIQESDNEEKANDGKTEDGTTECLIEDRCANPENFECDICNKLFSGIVNLQNHKSEHKHPFDCSICLKSYATQQALDVHSKSHQVHIHNVDQISKSTSLLKTPKVKIRGSYKKTKKGEYTCDMCPKIFKYSLELKNHMRIHTGERPYICSLCPKSYMTENTVKNHEKRAHGKIKEIKSSKKTPLPALDLMCEYCSKICKAQSTMDYHLKTHLEVAPFKCDQCEKRFVNSFNLKTHKRIHTKEKPYKCDECIKVFAHYASLKIHKNVHKGIKSFSCEFCEKKFTDQSGLKKHTRRIHTVEKPYQCDKCCKSFGDSIYLKRHKCPII